MGLSKEHRAWLNQHFGENVAYDEPMHRHTSFRIGGPADVLVRPRDGNGLMDLVRWCVKAGLPCFILGKGTNLLVKDKGIRGVVILVEDCLNRITHEKVGDQCIRLTAMAGASLNRACRYAMENGLGGLNFALGIPGSVGGAVLMNAGTVDGCMADVIDSVTLFWFSGHMEKAEKNRLRFHYRQFEPDRAESAGRETPFLILAADLILHAADPEVLKEDAKLRLSRRKATQPVHMPSAGCVFKNPQQNMPAGRMIDAAGLKGQRVGDAEVSTLHGNYIVNRGSATAADVMALMDKVQMRVLDQFGVRLEPEVRIVGE